MHVAALPISCATALTIPAAGLASSSLCLQQLAYQLLLAGT